MAPYHPAMKRPRLLLAHQLSLLLTAAVVLAVLVVGGVTLWNLRSGFTDYLRLRDEEQLTRLMEIVERKAALDPSMDWLRGDREAYRALVDELVGRPRAERRRPPPGPGAWPGREEPHREGPRERPPLPPPPLPGGPATGNLGDRIVITDAQGRWLAGREQPSHVARVSRAVKVQGEPVALIELVAEPTPEGLDARFLQRQTRGLVVVVVATLLVSLLLAWWVGGRWSRPLRALQHATRNIATGRRGIRLEPSGAREIAQLMDDVNAMASELTRLETARRLWLAQVSHELRTPLSVLRGELESIEDGVREPTPAVMASLREEVMQLNRLIDDLHTWSTAELGGLPCTLAPLDAQALLLRVVRRFGPLAQAQGLLLRAPDDGGPVLPVHWDAGRIEQLLSNLLTNSLRYTDAPGVVQVGWSASAGSIDITVDDSPPGVSREDMAQLFEPLFRASRARQRSTAPGNAYSSGLGLSIVRSIAQAHGGDVRVASSTLGGLRFTVTLPTHPGKRRTTPTP